MTILYLVCFGGGLLLAVLVMIYGVERSREANPAGERSFRLSPPLLVAFGVVFGATGYILTRRSVASAGARVGISAIAGLLAAVLAARLVTKWWAVVPEHDVDDERYVLQGHLARVTKSIAGSADGEVVFEVGSQQRVLRARGVDDATLEPGTEVVIERIEDDLAFVEAWQEVEKRL